MYMTTKLTCKQIMEKHLGQSITDEVVIHVLVDLRRAAKRSQTTGVFPEKHKALFKELQENKMI